MDLSTATPVEIDTALAAIYEKQWNARAERERWLKAAKEMSEGAAKHASGLHGGRYYSYTEERAEEYRAKAGEFLVEIKALDAEALPYEAQYEERRWTRFFQVQDGHIHSSMACSTCNKMGKATRFGWLPEWSGRSEDEALEALVTASAKTVLCTVCYPSAPVAWTTPRQDPNTCPGSKTYEYDQSTARKGYYSGNYGTCNHCGQRVALNKGTWSMRTHKKA